MRSDQEAAASLAIMQSAIQAAQPGGITAKYFEDNGQWEADLRHRFAEMSDLLEHDPLSRIKAIEPFLRELNSRYTTRYATSQHEVACRSIVKVIEETGWWSCEAPSLHTSSREQTNSIANTVSAILRDIQVVGAKRPYSLITKFLYFCFPQTFAIYDQQAAASIWMWSLFAFHEDNDGSSLERFSIDQVSDTSGVGYGAVPEFYRSVWESSPKETQMAAVAAADRLQETLRKNASRAVVGVIDLLDKLLWHANGNPIHLGLARPL